MKVLFISRATLFKDKGGDTVQLVNTADHLKELGVEVDIKLGDKRIDYNQYDLIHFFNIIRPADILYHIERSNKPFVISTIYVDYSEYEKKCRGGFSGFLFKALSPDLIEYTKAVARNVVGTEKIISKSYLLTGQKKSVKQLITKASLLLPNSYSEYRRLLSRYGVEKKYRVIPNAIDPRLFTSKKINTIKDRQLVLCVGRVEGRKNQLNLIRAVKNSTYKVIIIGAPASNQIHYFEACKQAASGNIEFINNLPQKDLLDYYSRAAVHVLPSWFETTGLSSLEAAVMDCNVVITDKGDTKEYFEDMAYYCDPASPISIRKAIDEAANNPFNHALREKILEHYTWTIAAKKTFEAYEEVLYR